MIFVIKFCYKVITVYRNVQCMYIVRTWKITIELKNKKNIKDT